uniref:WD repeat and HMG box DNA binding protein 1 n=1 Tax=Echinococcus granulosus TaxID=6210 RepID=A0A068WTM0_ECHGR|nr:WD repeat and HMG box DNA binding protein 1 [Echinococcus granulosus]
MDGKLRVYTSKDDPNPIEYVVGEAVNCILCKDETVIVGTEGFHVYLQNIDGGLVDGIATRFTAGVNCLALNKDKTRLLAGSSDFIVKLVDLTGTNASSREVTFRGHTGPILSVDFDPLETFAATSSCDGTVRIWRLSDASEVKRFSILSKFIDPEFTTSRCKLKWEPINAVPVERAIHIYDRYDNWNLARTLEYARADKMFIECEFLSDDEALAAISADGWLVIWNSKNKMVLYSIRNSAFENVCSMIWPQKNIIYCTDKFGAVGFISIDLPSKQAVEHSEVGLNAGLSPDGIKALFSDTDSMEYTDLINVASDQAEEEVVLAAAAAEAEAATEVTETSKKVGKQSKPNPLASHSEDEGDDGDTIAISDIKAKYLRELNVEDDDTTESLTPLTKEHHSEQNMVTKTATTSSASSVEIKSFQPGSMPSGFRERFLVWNHIGVVTLFEDDDPNDSKSTSIEVEFHDTTLHHGIHLEGQGFTMADLNATALMLASPGLADAYLMDAFDSGKAVDDSDLSTVLVRPLDNTAFGKESISNTASDWTVNLPPGEACRAISLVLGNEESLAVVATSSRLLRIFVQPAASAVAAGGSLQLLQATSLGLPPISLPGKDVVTMVSHPSLPILAVVVGWSNEDLYWRVFNFSITTGAPRGWAFGRLSSTFYPLPLSPSAHLTWLGFSEIGNLFTHDSAGCLRRLTHQTMAGAPHVMDFHWVPVCETRRCVKPHHRLNDCFFVVGVVEDIHHPMDTKGKSLEEAEDVDAVAESDRTQRIRRDELGFGQVQAIYCKASRWPRPIPKPIVTSLPFTLPLCGVYETDQGKLEENYLRTLVLDQKPFWGVCTDSETSLSPSRMSSRRKTLLRLFALASKLENDWAAITVAGLMPDVETVRLAIRYALRLNRSALANRIGRIALAMEEEEEEQRDEGGHSSEVDDKENKEGDNQEEAEEEEVVAEVLGESDSEKAEVEEEESSELPFSASDTASTSTQGSRFNPFKRRSEDGPKQQFGGRGSCVLDELKPPPARPHQAARSNVQKEGRRTFSGKTVNRPPSKAQSITSETSSKERAKRPPSDVPQSVAKRLSTFEFQQPKE